MSASKVIFFHIQDNAKKIQCICDTVRHFFYEDQALLIMVPSDEAAQYVDQLLWRQPKESFIPHMVANSTNDALVAITTTENNVNEAKILVNLLPDCRAIFNKFPVIYDFLDGTHPEKKQKSQTRLAYYQEHNYEILLS